MPPLFFKRAHCLILFAAIFAVTIPISRAQSPEAMATAHRWIAAKFLGEAPPPPAESYLLVYTQDGPVTKNGVQGHPLRIVNQNYSRGLHVSSDGKVRVVLAAPGERALRLLWVWTAMTSVITRMSAAERWWPRWTSRARLRSEVQLCMRA